MKNSWRLFTVWGIDIRVHMTFPLILLWAAWQYGGLAGNLSGALFGVVSVIFLFGLVTLHELGHSFAALYYGVPVEKIVLSPLGGVAQLNHMPEKPIQELVIAVAGPAVNLIIALIMGIIALLSNVSLTGALAVLSGQVGLSLSALFVYVFFYNIFLAAFNLIPAFPMDGGRILRSLMAMVMDHSRATTIAASIGRGIAILMGIYGLYNGAIFMVLIAVFIFLGAGQEAKVARLQSALKGLTVRQAYSPSVYRLNPYSTLQQAFSATTGGQRDFPVLQGEQLVGFLSRERLAEVLRIKAPHTWVGTVMQKNILPVSPYDALTSVKKRFDVERISALPVAENGWFLGIITRRNLADVVRMGGPRPEPLSQVQSI